MSNNKKSESPIDSLRSEAARQRWNLFHRAIAHAKESNHASLIDAESQSADADDPKRLLSVIR